MELWDIYDADKKPTGRTMKRNDWCLKDGEYHLTVLGVVASPDQTFLITKRVMTKAWAPGWWEVSGGAAQAGEESYEAVLREVKEETGLDARNAEGGYLFTYKRENPGEGDNYFVTFTVLSWILTTKTCIFRQRKQMATCLQRQTRSGSLQIRGSSYITTALSRRLKCDCVSRRKHQRYSFADGILNGKEAGKL